jgi:hypothetical protein
MRGFVCPLIVMTLAAASPAAAFTCKLSPDGTSVIVKTSNHNTQPASCTVTCRFAVPGGAASITCTQTIPAGATDCTFASGRPPARITGHRPAVTRPARSRNSRSRKEA